MHWDRLRVCYGRSREPGPEETYLPFQRAKTYVFFSPAPQKHPKSVGNGGPGPPRYRLTVLGNHWISKSGWGTGWAPLGCPGQHANFQYKIPSKGQPRKIGHGPGAENATSRGFGPTNRPIPAARRPEFVTVWARSRDQSHFSGHTAVP